MRATRGVTLVEVAVVVAIIVIVAAITFPVILSAKKAGRRTTCVANLSQIGKALALYAADHDNRYPPYNTADAGALTSTGDPSDLTARHPAALFKKALRRYGLSDGQFFCPDDPLGGSDVIDPDERTLKSVMTYEHAIGVMAFKRANYSIEDFQVGDVTAFAYLTDSAVGYRDVPGGPEPRRVALYPHDTVVNVLFLDGHVKGVTAPEVKLGLGD